MTEFEARLQECLDALIEGRWDLDECLRRYPEHAVELRPHLLAVAAFSDAMSAMTPREEFAAAARERFLVASGKRLKQAFDVEPDPTFFAAARARFLAAARRMRSSEASQPRRVIPLFGSPFRVLAGGLAAVTIFLGFSTYTVATASAALPGDWQYPVKLQTERVRLALAFGEDAERNVRLDRAEERAREIQALANKGKIIGPGVLDRMAKQTEPLVKDAEQGDWDAEAYERLQDVSLKQKTVLAEATGHVDPEAQEQLAHAADISATAVTVAAQELAKLPERPPAVITAPVLVTPANTSTPVPPAADAGTEVPGQETPVPAIGTDVIIDKTPFGTRNSVPLVRLSVGRMTADIPDPATTGWSVEAQYGDATSIPTLVRMTNADATSIITMNPLSGDVYWFINRNGRFDEVQMRITRDGQTFAADIDALTAIYADDVNIPRYIAESIVVEPEPTATPEPTDTPSPTTTATPAVTPAP